MNFKNKRLISTVIVVVLVVFSLIKGTITSSNSNKKDESELNGYLTEFLQEQSITKLTLKKGDSSQVIQKISIEGEINAEMTNTYSRGSVLNQIKEAKNNPNVKAILLSVNSPGGGVYETAELYNALKNSGKDVYVSMKKMAASGGYYVSTPAKKIFVNTETTTGSLGVIMSYVSAQKFLNDHGIKTEELHQDTAMWDTATAKDKMDAWLSGPNGSKIEVVICNNDGMALGAIESMKAAGKVLPTFGVDALPEALVKIEAGEMAGTVLNDAKGQASATFNMVVNLAQGKEPTEGTDLKLDNKIILIPSIGIDKSNVADFK